MAATLQGIRPGTWKYGRNSNGDEYGEAIYIVKSASDPHDASKCPGLPEIGDPHPSNNVIVVQSVEATALDDTQTEYDVQVQWTTPSATLGPASTQQVEWSFSTTQQKTSVDANGKTIGHPYFFWSSDAPYRKSQIPDRNAEIGLDIMAPALEAEVSLPVPSAFFPRTVLGLIGKVNQANFICDGTTFSAREAILLACSARRTSPAPSNAYEIRYRFAMGRSQLPLGLPVVYATTPNTPVSLTDIPLGDGYNIMYRPLRSGGTQIARSESDIDTREPIAVVVHHLYFEGDFSELGVT